MRTDSNLIFYFYRYVQPIWYLNLQSKGSITYWIDYRKLPPDEQVIIDVDQSYVSEDARLRDSAYQAWQKGIMHTDSELALPQPFTRLPIQDEYRFIRRHFNSIWSWYVLFIRILTLRNPFVELYYFFKTRNIKRVDVFKEIKKRDDYKLFTSSLVAELPMVSVIIPTLNRQIYLKDVLDDLALQHYKNFEVIVVDQNETLDTEFYSGWPFTLHAVHQTEKALWLARNTAIQMSEGEYVLLFDDDSRVGPDWIEQHLKCLDYFNCQLSAGVSISVVGAKVPVSYGHFRWADQLDTGNVMLKKEVFREVGLFDRQFEKQRMGDGEFGLRCYLAGFSSVSNPLAKRLHLKVSTGGLRQLGSWDGFRPTNWFAPRPIPSVLYLTRRYFGNRMAILDLLIKTPPSILSFKYKRDSHMLLLGSVLAIFILPFIFFQVLRSWNLATEMIRIGPKVTSLITSKYEN